MDYRDKITARKTQSYFRMSISILDRLSRNQTCRTVIHFSPTLHPQTTRLFCFIESFMCSFVVYSLPFCYMTSDKASEIIIYGTKMTVTIVYWTPEQQRIHCLSASNISSSGGVFLSINWKENNSFTHNVNDTKMAQLIFNHHLELCTYATTLVKAMQFYTSWGPLLEFPIADYKVIADMVLGQCFHRIIRF